MGRIDYLLFNILHLSCTILLTTWLKVNGKLRTYAVDDLDTANMIFGFMLFWCWLCASLNRAADTGMTRWKFVAHYFTWPILALIFFVLAPSKISGAICIVVFLLPTAYLYLWPGSRA